MKDDNGLDLGVEKYGFQHAIASCVRLRAGGEQKRGMYRAEIRYANVRYMVNTQETEICSGGLQRKYVIHGVMHGGAAIGSAIVVHEHELEACEPFPCEEEKPEPAKEKSRAPVDGPDDEPGDSQG